MQDNFTYAMSAVAQKHRNTVNSQKHINTVIHKPSHMIIHKKTQNTEYCLFINNTHTVSFIQKHTSTVNSLSRKAILTFPVSPPCLRPVLSRQLFLTSLFGLPPRSFCSLVPSTCSYGKASRLSMDTA